MSEKENSKLEDAINAPANALLGQISQLAEDKEEEKAVSNNPEQELSDSNIISDNQFQDEDKKENDEKEEKGENQQSESNEIGIQKEENDQDKKKDESEVKDEKKEESKDDEKNSQDKEEKPEGTLEAAAESLTNALVSNENNEEKPKGEDGEQQPNNEEKGDEQQPNNEEKPKDEENAQQPNNEEKPKDGENEQQTNDEEKSKSEGNEQQPSNKEKPPEENPESQAESKSEEGNALGQLANNLAAAITADNAGNQESQESAANQENQESANQENQESAANQESANQGESQESAANQGESQTDETKPESNEYNSEEQQSQVDQNVQTEDVSPQPPTSPRSSRSPRSQRTSPRSQSIFQTQPDYSQEDVEKVAQQFLKGEKVTCNDPTIIGAAITNMEEKRDNYRSEGQFNEYLNSERCIENAKTAQVDSLKKISQNAYQEDVKKKKENLDKDYNQFLQEMKQKESDMEARFQKMQEDLSKNQQREMDENDKKWQSEEKMRQYNRSSQRLRVLRYQQQLLINAKRFDEAMQVAKSADKLKAKETAENHQQMNADYKKSRALLVEKHDNEKKALKLSIETQRADFVQYKEYASAKYFNRMKYLSGEEEIGKDPERVWLLKHRNDLDAMTQRGIKKTHYKNKTAEVSEFNTLPLPPVDIVKSEDKKSKTAKK